MKKLPIALVMALSAVVAVAQEGAPAGAPKKAAAPAAAQDAAKPAALDAAAEAWVKTLAAKIADGNTVIRDSSVAAIEKVGKPALPVLNALATGTDKALADAAKKLAERIEKGQTGNDRRAMAGGQMKTVDDVAKELKLDDKKTEQLKELQKTAQDKMREMMEAMRSGELSREEMMSEMQAFRDELKGDLRKFLSEDEAKKVEESLGGSIMGGRGMGGGRGGQGGGGGRRGGGGGGV